jgi:hypothetical protein
LAEFPHVTVLNDNNVTRPFIAPWHCLDQFIFFLFCLFSFDCGGLEGSQHGTGSINRGFNGAPGFESVVCSARLPAMSIVLDKPKGRKRKKNRKNR